MAEPIVTVIPTILPGPTWPELPPRDAATHYPEGYAKRSSTGQLFEVKHGRWLRVPEAQ